ncbi:transglycosylase family protein [Arthrobacter sp. H14-L1]|uniref:transglycosylase family protein n=1 Tax=Arthrobacter sp. H14-L1 TaxID=2996697 RepID=UPI00226E4CB6|nr:transglycosylase family protein [Arthrobacter sp. H14-L1]MCY0904538.1 transglycosylase family protein [Arthrobacter sp. H14-L1]
MNKMTISRGLRRGIAVAAIAGAGLAVSGTAANAAPVSTWDALAQCESSGNWNTNTGNGFSGGLQFTPSTWAAYGGTGAPQNASKAQQIAVAERVQAGQGWGAWPACSAGLGLSGGGGAAPAPVQVQAQAVAPIAARPVAQAPVAPVAQAPVHQAPVYQAPVAQAPVQVAQAPVHVALSGETYTVVSGDTLSTIAEKLGVVGGWGPLYSANTGTIIHPDLIMTGQVLQLPA